MVNLVKNGKNVAWLNLAKHLVLIVYFYAYQDPQVKHFWFQKCLPVKINVINVENMWWCVCETLPKMLYCTSPSF